MIEVLWLRRPRERLAALIIEHQHDPTGLAHEGQRPHRPSLIELIFQLAFVHETIEVCPGRVVGGRSNKQHSEPVTIVVQSPATAEHAVAVLPHST
jgi:hypothetical protein